MREFLTDLITSPGWGQVKDAVKERRLKFLNELASVEDLSKVAKYQAAIREMNYLLQLPSELLKETKEKKDENERE